MVMVILTIEEGGENAATAPSGASSLFIFDDDHDNYDDHNVDDYDDYDDDDNGPR